MAFNLTIRELYNWNVFHSPCNKPELILVIGGIEKHDKLYWCISHFDLIPHQANSIFSSCIKSIENGSCTIWNFSFLCIKYFKVSAKKKIVGL